MKPVAFHPQAEAEFASATEFYRVERPTLAREFAGELERAVEFVRVNPEAGTPIRGAIRRWLIRRFPYSIIYREEENRIYILAVAHQRRRPEYWSDRA
ncbi:type II toxin-antitoxin system RelE/ParE family toxin [soil metagenome]